MHEPAPKHPLGGAPRTWHGARRSFARTGTFAPAVWAGVAASCAAVAGGAPPCDYSSMQVGTSVPCGFWGPQGLNPRSLNNLGHWGGYRSLCPPNDLFTLPLRWTPETGVTVVPTPPGVTSATVRGINDVGTAVGTFRTATHPDRACVWLPDGEFIEIPPTGGNPPTSWAAAVNNSNVVVGWRKVPGAQRAFIWQAGKLIEIDPTPFGTTVAEARAVSETGFVVGQIGGASNGSGRAFRWKDGAVEILQPLPRAITSNGSSVNASGVTVGNSLFQIGPDFLQQATIWGIEGQPIELPVLAGYQGGAATDINDDGLVLGIVGAPSQPGLPSSQYVVWIDGQVHSMTSLLGPGHGEIQDLNDLNQFVSGKVGGPLLFSPESVLGDLNGDCAVNGADLSLFLQQWGMAADTSADLNADGTVDGADLGILLGAWTALR